MCLYGVYKHVEIINHNQNKNKVLVDACIANEVQELNNNGVITLGSCCSHGLAGQIIEHENAFGKWKEKNEPPHVLIDSESIGLARQLGYCPYPYYYANGLSYDVWQMQLKSGCITEVDCKNWHIKNNISYEKNLGIIE